VRVKFAVTDKPKGFKDEWSRVVAVFLTGKVWQFNDWKWKTVNDMLSSVCGFYAQFDSEPIPKVMANWDATILKMSKSSKSAVEDAVRLFWITVEKFILERMPAYFQK